MTTEIAQTAQRGVEIVVPLTKLKKSPRNARRTPHTPAHIEALAASIAVKGVLQPPVLETERDGEGAPTGSYLVTIGEGRRQALALLAKRKVIAKTTPVRCTLDDANDAFEVSLDENVTRVAMHPADQFEAFRSLAETKGWSAEEIAARFGVSAQVVRQRLRLGAVSPKLMEAYRADDLTLDQLMAFAVSEDHERQEQVFDHLSYNRSASHIRRMMTENEVEASDRRATFVGVDAYQAAGGRVRRDLFVEDGGGWFEDVALLERLALEKLQAEADRVVSEDGWRWAEAHIDYPQSHGLRRLYASAPDHDEAEAARLTVLADEYDALVVGIDDEDELPEDVRARVAAIDAELQAASEPRFSEDQRRLSGVFIVLDWEGRLRIEKGFVRAEDEPQAPGPAVDNGDEGDQPADEPRDETSDGLRPLSDRLIADLTAHRTAALRDALAGQPQIALAATVHALVLRTFYHGRSLTCLELDAKSAALAQHAEGFAESIAARSIEARHAGWASRLPQEAEDVWPAILALSADDRLSLLAHCVSQSVNALRVFAGRASALAHAEVLAAGLGLDMNAYWRPTAPAYFARASKAHILAAVTEGVSPAVAEQLAGMKKDAMAVAAAERLAGTGWLPTILRSSGEITDPAV